MRFVQPFSVAACLRKVALLLIAATTATYSEDGSSAWLRYARVVHDAPYRTLPLVIFISGETPTDRAAGEELRRGLTSMLGRNFILHTPADGLPRSNEDAIVIGSASSLSHLPFKVDGNVLNDEQYDIASKTTHGRMQLSISGGTPKAALYGVFRVLEHVAAEQPLLPNETQTPAAAIRWSDEWDNLSGTVERGYAGPSIFFEKGHVRADLIRAGEYARLLASVGVNGCNVNNVNADLDTLSPEHLHEFARIAEVFRPWGVRLALSVDLTSPQTVGKLPSFDPLDPEVIAWWKTKVDEIYTLMPDFAGFTVKADSEGRKGPSQYGRSPADAANVLARALRGHGGVVLYRGFVYNNHLDWRDPKADRARAGVDNFVRYDGTFEPNVVIQIKEGPIDFQAREPVSPLFAALRHSNVAIELQTAQEYTGQQRHMVFLPSMWKYVLDTDLRAPRTDGKSRATPVKQIVTGQSFPNADGTARLSGFISVTNVGLEANWMHHPMALANLYGFGRLAWNPDTPLNEITDTWTRMTWGNDPAVVRTVTSMLAESWQVYEGYTGPNGMGTLTNILGYHFGPGIESAERNGWGQWFRGEKEGIGMDRTAAGTGYAQQYPPELAAQYESLATCPDDLLLFFHHVPYDYRLHNGKTLVQSIYDTHYASTFAASQYVPQWQSLQGKIDADRYSQVLRLFEFQASHAIVWRDAVNAWFQRASGIADDKGRVGHDGGRIEAETMQSTGYQSIDVIPWETASGSKAVACHVAAGCTLRTVIDRPAGKYNVAVQYFDTWLGASQFELLVNDKSVARWSADDTLPAAQYDAAPDGQTSTRFTAHSVSLKQGDTLTLRALPDLRQDLIGATPPPQANGSVNIRDFREYAPVDYIVVGPDSPTTPQ